MKDAACANLDSTKSHIYSLYERIKGQNARFLQMENAEADLLLNQQIEKQQWEEETTELNKKHQKELNDKTTELCRLDDEWSLKEEQWIAKEAEFRRKEEQWLAKEVELLRKEEERNLKKFFEIEEVLEVSTEGLKYRIENWIQLEEDQILNTVCDIDMDSDPFQQPSTSGKTRPLFIGLELPMPPLRKRKAED